MSIRALCVFSCFFLDSAQAGGWFESGIAMSDWLQEMDDKICDKVGQLFGSHPDRCSHNRRHAAVAALVTENPTRCKSSLLTDMLLRNERAKRQRMEKQFLVAQNDFLEAKVHIANLTSKNQYLVAQQEAAAMENASRDEYNHCLMCFTQLYTAMDAAARHKLSNTEAYSVNSLAQDYKAVVALVLVTIFVVLLAKLIARCRCCRQKVDAKEPDEFEKRLHHKTSELLQTIAQMQVAGEDSDLDGSCSDATKSDLEILDGDFSFQIFEAEGQETTKSIKIKCPGVQHDDIVIDVLYNGCIVTIDRKASQGVDAVHWVKRFEFNTLDGRFDLRDNLISLDGGFLNVVLRLIPNRVFRFKAGRETNFDMAETDEADDWLYSDDSPTEVKNVSSVERASRILRLAEATSATKRTPLSSAASSSNEQDDLDGWGLVPIEGEQSQF